MSRFTVRMLTVGLVVTIVGGSLDMFGQDASGAAGANNPTQTSQQGADSRQAELPESPGATQSTQGSTPAPISPASAGSTQLSPSGTAAAPAVAVSGNLVSRPAGAAIAPPKQRQVRSFLIKMGLIAGAGVALGTVTALSLSSPARVPGSH
jgi:hypothetical protein